jgi:RimJ/RimL family protein N-acetyltransferase
MVRTKRLGYGYATASARAALDRAVLRVGLNQIVSYTSPDNRRSQAVMVRLDLLRDPSRDFIAEYDGVGLWRGMVRFAHQPISAQPQRASEGGQN